MATVQTLAKFLAICHELYPTREVSAATAEAWEIALRDVSDESFRFAADKLLKEPGRTFFPTPNELRVHLPARPMLMALPDPTHPVEAYYRKHPKTCRWCGGRMDLHDPTCRMVSGEPV